MEIRLDILVLILGCGAVTVLPRVLPLLLLRKLALPRWYREWLSYIPVTIMSALVAQELIPPAGGDWDGGKIAAFGVSLLCAMVTKSLFLTVVGGVAAISLINFVF